MAARRTYHQASNEGHHASGTEAYCGYSSSPDATKGNQYRSVFFHHEWFGQSRSTQPRFRNVSLSPASIASARIATQTKCDGRVIAT